MKTIRMGIFGLNRGSNFIESILANNAEIVALCDMDTKWTDAANKKIGGTATCYTNFDEFIEHPMDAVFLANFFHEHTPYAIRCLEKNIHVISECTSNSTMAEGVALVRAAKKSKAFYMISENYPYMLFNQEIRRVYKEGTLGKVLFAEGEYNHPARPRPAGSKTTLVSHVRHWRNYLPRTYYITHSLAPLMLATGSKPVRVTALPVFDAPKPSTAPSAKMVFDTAAIVTTLNDDNSVFRVTGHASFAAHGNSYRLCCTNGMMENVRGMGNHVMLRYNDWNVPEGKQSNNLYVPDLNDPDADWIYKAGHGGGDFFVIREFLRCIRENRKPEMDEYFATRMASVAILGHRSLMEGGMPYDIPDFSKEEDCAKWENDNLSPFWYTDGRAPTLPCCSHPECSPSQEQIDAYAKLCKEERENK